MLSSQVIDIRGSDEGLYSMFKEWWAGHSTRSVGLGMLPKCGVMVSENHEPRAACWLYMDNSIGVCWAAWITTKPGIAITQSVKCLDFLLESAETVAKSLNYGVMLTMTDREGLTRFLTKRGWEGNHSGMTQLFKVIKNGS